ncbi:MAG: GrpB family protein [Halanaerobiales bacterium]|nr:GrpB family protein [Halanaerobiales bacterium]
MDKRKISVKPYNENWKVKYNKEKYKLEKKLNDIIVKIYHIGSTAIPNIKAKPIIDILVVVEDINKVDRYNDSMQALGYEPKGEFGIENRRFFQKGGNNRTHHVHIFQKGDKEIKRHLNFRDYMRAHPKEARKYSQLKETLADKYYHDINKYIEGKNDFIAEIDNKAVKWSNKNQ